MRSRSVNVIMIDLGLDLQLRRPRRLGLDHFHHVIDQSIQSAGGHIWIHLSQLLDVSMRSLRLYLLSLVGCLVIL